MPFNQPLVDPSSGSVSHKYTAELATSIEANWQQLWEDDGTYWVPNVDGDLAGEVHEGKMFIMDMFPYPSGSGLHVGHPFGFIATDVYARFQRMLGKSVLHTMGFDAFGLPAEQYAIQEGIHPKITTEKNIATYLDQIKMIGLGHDSRRRIQTTSPSYYRWTQWIFSQIYNSWFDEKSGKARPIAELITELTSGVRQLPDGRDYASLSEYEKFEVLNDYRLAYLSEATVIWCPGLGTVLSAEEVTAEGKSERGNFPVFRKPMQQWVMRITAYADRLIADLDTIDWPEKIVAMQKNWIGKSQGAHVDFTAQNQVVSVFTTRVETLGGVSFLALAPEYEQLEKLLPSQWPAHTPEQWKTAPDPSSAVAAYRSQAANKSDLQRKENKEKTGQFTGIYAKHPWTGADIPIFVADYVLPGYGTGAVMGVPAHDQRDFEFAERYGLPIVPVLSGAPEELTKAHTAPGVLIHSEPYNGLTIEQAREKIIQDLRAAGIAEIQDQYRLRDWIFARQRYWGEPFPIVYDEQGIPHVLPDDQLPLMLPEIADFRPTTFDPYDADSMPAPPLARNTDWVNVTLDLGNGPQNYRRETNTMPNWAGSCSYYLRYMDPNNSHDIVSPANEHYWMLSQDDEPPHGGVDLYVGGVEHAVLHLLYARFWHKVLYDLGHVSTIEPFKKLYNQGMIQAYAYTDQRGVYVPAREVVERDGAFFYNDEPVNQEFGKIGKSLKNAISPNEICAEWGADTFRLYEMSLGPLDQSTTWSPRDIVGSHRFLQRLWRTIINEETGECIVTSGELDPDLAHLQARTILEVREDYENLRFNTAIAKLIQFTNYLTKNYSGATPRKAAETLILLAAPIVPHIAEELWHRLGHTDSAVLTEFPQADLSAIIVQQVEVPVQINGKIKHRLSIDPDMSSAELEKLVLADTKVQELLTSEPRKIIIIPAKLVNIVL